MLMPTARVPTLSPVKQAGAYAGLGLAVVFGLVAINLIYKWADRKYVFCSM